VVPSTFLSVGLAEIPEDIKQKVTKFNIKMDDQVKLECMESGTTSALLLVCIIAICNPDVDAYVLQISFVSIMMSQLVLIGDSDQEKTWMTSTLFFIASMVPLLLTAVLDGGFRKQSTVIVSALVLAFFTLQHVISCRPTIVLLPGLWHACRKLIVCILIAVILGLKLYTHQDISVPV